MILYNVTIGIDKEVELEWINWMKNEHIPKVIATGMFSSHRMFKVISQEEEDSVSYSIQYFSEDLDKVVHYLENLAPPLVEEHMQKYKNRHVAFRTLLEEVYL